LVLIGVALCVFGPARTATSHAAIVTEKAAVSNGIAVVTVDHAVVARPAAAAVADWSKLAFGAAPLLAAAAALIVAMTAVADRDRVVLAMVGVPWRRRGPPTSRA